MNLFRGAKALGALICWIGTGHLYAETPTISPPTTISHAELRGLWVDATQPGLKSVAAVTQLINTARKANFNALWVEVRKQGVSYFRSDLEPLGTVGSELQDPLAEVLRQARDTTTGPPLEVHAWVDLLTVWDQPNAAPPQPTHLFRQHPDWLTQHRNGTNFEHAYLLDPGHPAVSEHLVSVIRELVSRYELDGLVLDGLRYPNDEISGSNRGWGYNPVAVQRFQRLNQRPVPPTPTDVVWEQFRRQQLTALVRRIALDVGARRPALRLAATGQTSPNGEYPITWENTAPYRDQFQDWRSWVREGWLDTIVPLLNFNARQNLRDWQGWSAFVKENRSGRQVVVGLKTANDSLSNTLTLAHSLRDPSDRATGTDGLVVFGYGAAPMDHTPAEFLTSLVAPGSNDTNPAPLFANPTLVPTMPWKLRPTRARLLVQCLEGNMGMDGARADLRGPVNRTYLADANGWIGSADLLPGEYLVTVRPFHTNTIRWVATFTAEAGRTQHPNWLPADEDADRDGVTNLAELTVGTDPQNPTSKLALEVTVLPDRLQLQVRPARPGRQYHLEAADQLTGPWISVADPASLDGSEASVELPTKPRYYRTRVQY